MTSHRGTLALGSNIGDKAAHLSAALDAIEALEGVSITKASQFYQTAPWGDTEQDWFLNACAEIETTLAPEALLAALKGIETEVGRTKTRHWGPRVIDIDILTLGALQVAQDALTIPHPRIAERAFVLVPLIEICPDLMVGEENVQTLLARLPREEGDVFPYNP